MCFVKSQLVLVGTVTPTFSLLGGPLKGVSLSGGRLRVGVFTEGEDGREEEGPGMEKLWRVKERDPPRHRQKASAS